MHPDRRGNDWLDGALAGWLMVAAVQAGGAVGEGGAFRSLVAAGTAILLAAAIVPFLRLGWTGWLLATAGLLIHLAASAGRAEWGDVPRALAALLPHLLALGYLAYARDDFSAAPAVEPAAEAAPAVPRRRTSAPPVVEEPRAAPRPEREETVDAGIPLQPGERCLAARAVELYRVPRGEEPGAGGFVRLDEPRDLSGHTRAGACRLLLTDRRVVLVAPSGQQSPLPLDRVARAAVYRDGVEVRPAIGPALFIRFHDGVDDFAARLSRALPDRTPPRPT